MHYACDARPLSPTWDPDGQRRIIELLVCAGARDLQLEIVRMLLAAGATMADVDRNGIPVADRIQSQALRNALASHLKPRPSDLAPAGPAPPGRDAARGREVAM